MNDIRILFENNKKWAQGIKSRDPQFFDKLSHLQQPKYLWIGCADSRVPANEITGLLPGELFVHRNIANVVVHTDLNCLSVVQYAVDVLKVEHVIVCGHYGCGGVRAALESTRVGLADNWIKHIEDVMLKYNDELNNISSHEQKLTRLCELNAIEQANNICKTTIIQDAWDKGRPLSVHAWVYGLNDGLLTNLSSRSS